MSQRPLQLILARNFLGSVATPAFLVDDRGVVVFFNDAAGALLGRRFEETGHLALADWLTTFGPFAEDGAPLEFEDLPLTRAGRRGRPSHSRFRIRSVHGEQHEVESTALPIVGDGNFQGAMVVFWPIPPEGA